MPVSCKRTLSAAQRGRTVRHTHPSGQTIYVTDGVVLRQRRRGPIEVIRRGGLGTSPVAPIAVEKRSG
jgi:quercetin dioxygenase-like cupin family protein